MSALTPHSSATLLLHLIHTSIMTVWTSGETRRYPRAALQHAIAAYHDDPVKLQELHDIVKGCWQNMTTAIRKCYADTGVLMDADEVVGVIMFEEYRLAMNREAPRLAGRFPWYVGGLRLERRG